MITKNTGSDAWWEGESVRGRGQFPSNYVVPIVEEATPSPVAIRRRTIHEKGLEAISDVELNASPSSMNGTARSVGATPASITTTMDATSPGDPTPVTASEDTPIRPSGFQVRALYDYTALNADELSISAGDEIMISKADVLFVQLIPRMMIGGTEKLVVSKA